ncbi:DUF192 domain-containing protein [Aquimarina intermedia]|uniref:DUF192 domain-containing protein n=1 Tax=Aquimarina intermedia TaxID=350814 RepID=A0A5S5BVD1_9FLAO|nr:DUF192 domain-containing protein [Aquimarina intermedia]TYP70987.1 hypothetical protein BD809_11046 [Aquimarina intermedia]
MITTSKLLGCLAILLASQACQDKKNNTIKDSITEEISFTKEGELQLLRDNDTLKQLSIEIADNPYERETGLMYRKTMEQNQGMLFISEESKPQNFYMKNTLIPLDIIYIDENQKIVSFQRNAQPNDETSLPSRLPAKYILEVNAGLSKEWNLKEGDSISFKKL